MITSPSVVAAAFAFASEQATARVEQLPVPAPGSAQYVVAAMAGAAMTREPASPAIATKNLRAMLAPVGSAESGGRDACGQVCVGRPVPATINPTAPDRHS